MSAAIIVVLAGGAAALLLFQNDPPPRHGLNPRLDAKEITHLSEVSVGKLRWLVKYDEAGHQTRFVKVLPDEQDFENLILTLLPIRDGTTAAFRHPDYGIVIQAGKNGVTIRVSHNSPGDAGEMLVEYDGRYFSGGNSAEFRAIAESLLRQSE